MALVFDLNTGRFDEEIPTSKSREKHHAPALRQSRESGLGLALTESPQPATLVADPNLANLASVDANHFIRSMEQKGQ